MDDEGSIEVKDSYQHKVVGPIYIYSNEEKVLGSSSEKKTFTLEMLKEMRKKAYSMGANRVIYAQVDTSSTKPVATGYAVVVKRKKKRRLASRK
ncbi:MAG: hypothetical protein ACJAS4_002833 [Bacteriovoracaceae bacterium]|jgi:hypothetical protein